MSKEYESLTAFIPRFEDSSKGKWIVDNYNDGSSQQPIHMPFVHYDAVVIELEDSVYQFVDNHEDTGIRYYQEYLEKRGIEFNSNTIANYDTSELDGLTVVALLLTIIRQDRFCEGLLLEFCHNSYITKWLKRLKEIDDSPNGSYEGLDS